MCDDDRFERSGNSQVCILCVMLISLEVWKLGRLNIVRDDDKVGSLQVDKFTRCV